MKVIFLDIDGVLNNTSWLLDQKNFDNFCPDNVKIFNYLVKRIDAKVVISSTWRLDHRNLKKIFKDQGVNCDIVGFTPDLSKQENGIYRGVERGAEIWKWILDWGGEKIDNFVILDDENDMGTLHQSLIQTNMSSGLTLRDAVKVIKYFEEYNLNDLYKIE
jgi:hypothetical protein